MLVGGQATTVKVGRNAVATLTWAHPDLDLLLWMAPQKPAWKQALMAEKRVDAGPVLSGAEHVLSAVVLFLIA